MLLSIAESGIHESDSRSFHARWGKPALFRGLNLRGPHRQNSLHCTTPGHPGTSGNPENPFRTYRFARFCRLELNGRPMNELPEAVCAAGFSFVPHAVNVAAILHISHRISDFRYLGRLLCVAALFIQPPCEKQAAAQVELDPSTAASLLQSLGNQNQKDSSDAGTDQDGWKALPAARTPNQAVTGDSPPDTFSVPVSRAAMPPQARVEMDGDRVTIVAREAPLTAVLNSITDSMNLNVVSTGGIKGEVTLSLHSVPVQEALDAILSINGYRWVLNNNIMLISELSSETALPPIVQGRQVRVFTLDFVSASEISNTITQLMSPVGTSSVTEIAIDNKLKTREQIVVEDLPEYLARIENYILQTDQPPQQVLIEAHILQVRLGKDNRHGVQLENIAGLASGDVEFGSNGIATATGTPSFFLNVNSSQVQSVIEMIESTTDAKTLASPRVLAVNGQEASIQIGEQLGYLTSTTTQTSTVQSVNFLNLGVLLRVTPIISRDGRILMSVEPEVSSGRINATTGLPDAETTEVATTCLLPNGHSMIVGGLIQETDNDTQSRVPGLGSAPVIGKLFQRRDREKDRSEIIIVLTPRIVPYEEAAQYREAVGVQQATTPLMYGPLISVDRTQHEAQLPNAGNCIDPLGKPMACFPSSPVAYSQSSNGFANPTPRYPNRHIVPNAQHRPGLSRPYQPPAEAPPVLPRPIQPAPLPPVSYQQNPKRRPIQQTSGTTTSRLKNATLNLFRRRSK